MENLSVWRKAQQRSPTCSFGLQFIFFQNSRFCYSIIIRLSYVQTLQFFTLLPILVKVCMWASEPERLALCVSPSPPSSCVTAKGSRSKISDTHKEISRKHFSCVYSLIKLYFFPDRRLSGPKTGIRGYHSSTFLAFIVHLCLSCRKLILN